MSGFDLIQNPDGADFQAQAVLAYVRYRIGSGIERSWDAAYHRYSAEPKVTRYDNGREQGYVVYLRSRDYQEQINIAFYEHRNSDSIHAVLTNERTFNAPVKDDILKVMTDKYDTTQSVSVGDAAALAEWIVEQLNEFWARTDKSAEERQREREAETKRRNREEARAREEAAKKRTEDAGRRARARATPPRSWWEVLGVTRNASQAVVKAAWRKLAIQHHPDNGGDTGKMQEVNAAWTEAQRGFKMAA